VHFGRWWDIEFGLPIKNPNHWGFSGVPQRSLANDPRIVALDSKDYAVSEEKNRFDRDMMTYLTRPPNSPDTAAAFLLHTICAAHRRKRRLICRLKDTRLVATLSGFEAIASRFSVRIHCNWNWPPLSGFTIRPFSPEPPALKDRDWVVEETDCGLRVYEHGKARVLDILPTAVPVNAPEFNPVLARRFLRACLYLQAKRAKTIAIYGAGAHTRSLLQWGLPNTLELAAIVETRSLATLEAINFDALLLSSASFESDMWEQARKHGIRNVIQLYGDWPKDIWQRRESHSQPKTLNPWPARDTGTRLLLNGSY
jgi:hypothetical protein